MNSSTKKTDVENDIFTRFLQDHRIGNNDAIVEKLIELGATEISDLLDLEEEDITHFQPPLMKKLEFVRFKRAIESLRVDQNSKTAEFVAADEPNKRMRDECTKPPLPPSCPGKACNGTLSVALGKRVNKQLSSLNGPNFRWIVSCSNCATTWHACHFLCGHISKISPIGSSDISRHEMGRFNRWQKKVKQPCRNNPDIQILKATYDEEWRKQNPTEVTKVPKEIPRTIKTSVASSDLSLQTGSVDSNLMRNAANQDPSTIGSSSSFEIDLCDDALFSDPLTCTGTGSKRVKLADGSHSREEVKPDCPISSMCREINCLILDEVNNDAI